MTEWLEAFPALAALPAEDRAILTERAKRVTLPAGTTVFAPGRPPESFLLLLEGTVRVQQASASGHEIVLYRASASSKAVLGIATAATVLSAMPSAL